MNTALKQFTFGGQPAGLAAFTLIELLIAVAISAIVLSVVSTLFFSALRLRERAGEVAEQTLPVDRAIAIMKRDLLGIVPVGKLAGPMGSDAVGIGMTSAGDPRNIYRQRRYRRRQAVGRCAKN